MGDLKQNRLLKLDYVKYSFVLFISVLCFYKNKKRKCEDMKNGSGDFSWTNIYCFAFWPSSSFMTDFTFQQFCYM